MSKGTRKRPNQLRTVPFEEGAVYELDVWHDMRGRSCWHWSIRQHAGLVTRVCKQGEAPTRRDATLDGEMAALELGMKLDALIPGSDGRWSLKPDHVTA